MMGPLILLALLIGLMQAAASFNPAAGLGTAAGGTVLGGGFLLLSAHLTGMLFKQIGLPRLTGYLVMGVVAGPSVLHLVSDRMLDDLSIFNGLATALIALNAGSELDIHAMRPLFRQLRWIAGLSLSLTLAMLIATVFLTRDMLPFTAGLDSLALFALALPLAVTLTAQSPAVVVALRKELNAKGPVTDIVLGLVVAAEIAVVLLFAVAAALSKAVLGGATDWKATLLHTTWEIPGSLVTGVAVGYLISLFMRAVRKEGALFVVGAGFLIAEVGRRVGLDVLLVALAAGLFIRNFTQRGHELHDAIDAGSLPIYVTFFSVAGAALHLDALGKLLVPVLIFCAVRATGYLAGARLGARLAGAPPAVRSYAGFGMLPQAGLALSLALLFVNQFPTFGAEAAALVFGVVSVNELISPVLYRMALVRAGEANVQEELPAPAEAVPAEGA